MQESGLNAVVRNTGTHCLLPMSNYQRPPGGEVYVYRKSLETQAAAVVRKGYWEWREGLLETGMRHG